MDNANNKEKREYKFTQVLSYSINESDTVHKYDDYCVPLYWFVKIYCKRSHKITMSEIAKLIGTDPTRLTRKLDIKNSQHRSITEEEINGICKAIGMRLSSILFLYEYKDYVEKILLGDDFNRLTELLSGNFQKISDFTSLSDKSDDDELSKTSSPSQDSVPVLTSSESHLKPLVDKWYFYFPSGTNKIVHNCKKIIQKENDNEPADSVTRELYNLYSPDQIYSGTVNIDLRDDKCHAILQYMTNPNSLSILTYEGFISCPADDFTYFGTLANQKEDEHDLIYLIMGRPTTSTKFQYITANVLALSRNEEDDDDDDEHHRPCSLRMILSRNKIEYDSPAYKILISNLMMNDNKIRIDETGYGLLKQHQHEYASPALDYLLQVYPEIGKLRDLVSEKTNAENALKSNDEISENIAIKQCAYINEDFLGVLTAGKFSKKELLYLEALLRRHSTASWYSKTKAGKVNQVLKPYRKQ